MSDKPPALDGVSEADCMMCTQLLKGHYHRLNPRLPTQGKQDYWMPDNWKSVPALIEVAEKFDITPTLDWLKREWI